MYIPIKMPSYCLDTIKSEMLSDFLSDFVLHDAPNEQICAGRLVRQLDFCTKPRCGSRFSIWFSFVLLRCTKPSLKKMSEWEHMLFWNLYILFSTDGSFPDVQSSERHFWIMSTCGSWLCSWAHAVISMTESSLLLLQCHPRAKRS